MFYSYVNDSSSQRDAPPATTQSHCYFFKYRGSTQKRNCILNSWADLDSTNLINKIIFKTTIERSLYQRYQVVIFRIQENELTTEDDFNPFNPL
jgi:hypothetical protein